MGKQNNLQATFYGKVGQVVGQRFKDKNVIRAYVIPKYTRTPQQATSREIFARSSKLASIAMGVNFRAYMWENPSLTEYTLRVKTANLKIRNGTEAVQTLPIIPLGFQPTQSFDDLAIVGAESWSAVSIVSPQAVTIPEQRKVCTVLAYRTTAEDDWHFLLHHQVTQVNYDVLYPEVQNDIAKPFELQAVAITCDDNNFGNRTIYWHYKKFI